MENKERMRNKERGGKEERVKRAQVPVFDIFSNVLEKRPLGAVIFPRIAFFDPVERVRNKELLKIEMGYSNVRIEITRPVLSITDHKILLALMKSGKFVKETTDGYVFHYSLSEIRRIASLPSTFYWKILDEHLERFYHIKMKVQLKTDEGMRLHVRGFIIGYDIVEKQNGKDTIFYVKYTKDFIDLLRTALLYNLPVSVIQEMNKIENPIVYRLVSYFITQTKPLKWELFDLLDRLTVLKFDTKKKRHKVLKSIEENVEILEKYGITPTLKKEGKKKTYILEFQPSKEFNFQIGKAVTH